MDKLEVMGVEEFLKVEFQEEDVLGGRLLQMGGLMLVAGATEVGKSFLVKQLAFELALGGSFLGLWKVTRPFRVLLLQAEIGKAAFQARMRKLSKWYGRAENLQVATHYTLRIDEEKNWVELNRVVQGEGIEVLILDPMRPFHLGDENSSQDMERFFGQIKKLQDTGRDLAVVQTHHERKPIQGVPGDMASIRGSALITDRPDTILRLSKKGKTGPVWKLQYEKIRNAETPEKPGDETLYVVKSGLFEVRDGGGSEREVVKVLGSSTHPWGEAVELLAVNMGCSEGKAGRLLRRLVEEGKLVEGVDGEDGRKKTVRRKA